MSAYNLVDNERIATLIEGGRFSHEDWNELNDQLRALFKARWYSLKNAYYNVSTGDWDFIADASSYGLWSGTSGASQSKIFFPLPLMEGQEITDIEVTVFSSADIDAGKIALYKIAQSTWEGSTPYVWTEVLDIAGSNPWKNSVYTFPHTFTQTGQSIILDEKTDYAIIVTPSDHVGALQNNIYHVAVKAKLGN